MSDGYTCPKEGCDYGEAADENKTLAAVRSHINSAGGHDWHDLKADLYAAAEADDVPDSYDNDDGTEEESDEDDEESGDEQTEESDENGAMATEEEYQEQHSDGDSDGVQDSDSGDQSATGDGGDGFALPAFSATTWLFIGGLLLAAFLAYRLFGGDAAADYEPPEESGDAGDSEDDGGLVADDVVEGGTGGVQA